jgi:uncharacterized membrane protein YqjE
MLGVLLLAAGLGLITSAVLAVLAIFASAPVLALLAGVVALPSVAYLAAVVWRRRRSRERGPLFG